MAAGSEGAGVIEVGEVETAASGGGEKPAGGLGGAVEGGGVGAEAGRSAGADGFDGPVEIGFLTQEAPSAEEFDLVKVSPLSDSCPTVEKVESDAMEKPTERRQQSDSGNCEFFHQIKCVAQIVSEFGGG